MKVFLDLFSGLGGAARAFDESPNWRTIKIDNNPELIKHNRGLIIHDLAQWEEAILIIRNIVNFDEVVQLVIWASPPCDQFSWARQNGDNPRRMGQTAEDFDLTLFDAACQIIEHFRDLVPNLHWIIENVHGAKPIFTEELGLHPRQEIGSVVLWGDFPLIPIEHRDTWKHRKLDAKGSRSLRPNFRAMVPMPISLGLLNSLEKQTTLNKWCIWCQDSNIVSKQ